MNKVKLLYIGNLMIHKGPRPRCSLLINSDFSRFSYKWENC